MTKSMRNIGVRHSENQTLFGQNKIYNLHAFNKKFSMADISGYYFSGS